MCFKLYAQGNLGVACKPCCSNGNGRNVNDHLALTISRMKTSRTNKVYPDIDHDSMTKTSKFIRFLLRVCFLVITQKDNKISFSKCKTAVYISLTISWLFIIPIVSSTIGADRVTDSFNKEVKHGMSR